MKRILLFLATNIAIVLVLSITMRTLASTIVMCFSRQREFRADQGGARLAGKHNMIAALERLNQMQPSPLPDRMAAFGISGGALRVV